MSSRRRSWPVRFGLWSTALTTHPSWRAKHTGTRRTAPSGSTVPSRATRAVSSAAATHLSITHSLPGSPAARSRCEDPGVSTYEQIMVEQADAVLRITLNRPEKMNAWTPHMMGELTRAITAANDDRSIGAIVVTGAGRGFCAGADIEAVFDKGLKEGHRESPEPRRRDDWVSLCRDSKPLIAAINGASIGVGLTLVLPFDQIIAARGAKLSARF